MKRGAQLFFIVLFGLLLLAVSACSQIANSHRPAEFVATTPCSIGTKPLPGMAQDAQCDLIKWDLKLFENKVKQMSGTYVLDCNYGLSQQGTKELKQGGKHLHREGKWVIVKGTKTNPAAVIYRLDPDRPKESISFLRLNKNLIHLLDNHQHVMIGNGGSSYTLNRVQR